MYQGEERICFGTKQIVYVEGKISKLECIIRQNSDSWLWKEIVCTVDYLQVYRRRGQSLTAALNIPDLFWRVGWDWGLYLGRHRSERSQVF